MSILDNHYDISKIEILIACDACTDQTMPILQNLQNKYPQIKLLEKKVRSGKPQLINELKKMAKADFLIITDANVILNKNTLTELMRFFTDEKIGLVDTRMQNKNAKNALEEKRYNQLENFIKRKESQSFGLMMGPFGGCFAIRKELYSPIPPNFLVDDFFLNMSVINQGYYTIQASKAHVSEDLYNSLNDEFKRKVRIGTGNFQNLFYFKNLVISRNVSLTFLYWSHKIIRWFSAFFMLFLLLTSLILSRETYYKIFLYLYLISIFASLINIKLRQFNIEILFLRIITHFYAMNIALLVGFVNFLKGVKTNVWQPTKRNQNK
jgi:cellulose synthase/poly-beta-1,6-N-acetylglucosamine synthase-like glycosyltransferase